MWTRYGNDTGPRRIGLVAAVGLHAVAIAALLSHPPLRAAVAAAPIMVNLIAPEPVTVTQAPPKPRAVRPKPEPAPQRKPVTPLPVIATASTAPAPIVAAAPPPRELPPARSSPARTDTAATTPATTAAIAPVVSPRFDAAYLRNPPPVYPPLARRLGEQGRVLLRVLVTAEGTAQRVELKASSGAERLDRAALDAVKRWKFVPAHQGDQAVSDWVVVPISFSLEG